MSATEPSRPNNQFPTTQWTLVARLHVPDAKVSARALDDLCRQYHYPLYCLIRSRGLSHHDAEDALHDFFAKLLRLGAFHDLAAEKGRLRTYLSASLSRFLVSRHHREKIRETHELSLHDAAVFAFDPGLEQRYESEIMATKLSPDVIYDQQWCAQLLNRVLDLLEAEYTEAGKAAIFLALRPILMSGGSMRDHDSATIAASLSMNEIALRTALNRLLSRYRKALTAEVLETVENSEDVDAEIAYLMSVMSCQ